MTLGENALGALTRPEWLEEINISFALGESTRARSAFLYFVSFWFHLGYFHVKTIGALTIKKNFLMLNSCFGMFHISAPGSQRDRKAESSEKVSLYLCVFIKCCHSVRQPGPLMIYFYIFLSTATLFAPVSKCLVKVPWGAITEQHK